jgi:hypothetical protein
MKIILVNGVELSPIAVTGGKRNVQGANRDTLCFVFPAEASMDELDAIFTAANCETITIVEGENKYIHNAYTVRAELKRVSVEVDAETESTEAVYENRVFVAMGQRTYMETKLAETQAAMNALLTGEV